MKTNRTGCLIAGALWLALPIAAMGQGVPPDVPGRPSCPPLSSYGSADLVPPDSQLPQSGEKPAKNLSNHLAQTDGVICPPTHVDPDIKVPAPNVGRMPVIPPPGSDDPSIRPK